MRSGHSSTIHHGAIPVLAAAILVFGVATSTAGDSGTEERVLAPVDSLEVLAEQAREDGRHADVARFLLESVAVQRRVLGPDHEEVSETLEEAGQAIWNAIWALRKEGRYSEAVALADTFAAYRESAPGVPARKAVNAHWLAVAVRAAAELPEEERREFTVADSLSDFIEETDDHEAAIAAIEHQLGIRRRVLGDEHPDVARSLARLGDRAWNLGDYERSEAANKEAVEIALATLGENHDITANYIGQLANCYQWMEEYDRADSLSLRSYEILLGLYGEDHPATLLQLSLRGWLQTEMGRYAEAEGMLREALAGQIAVLGEHNGDTAATMNNLSYLLVVLSRYEEAEELKRKALEIRTSIFGEVSVEAGVTTHGYAAVRNVRGDHVTAERLFRRAMDIYMEVWSPDHPRVGEIMADLANCLIELGRYDEAVALFREILERWPEHSGYVSEAYSGLSYAAAMSGDPAAAEEHARKSLRITEEVNGHDHPATASCMQVLANRLAARGNLVAAEAMLREALARMRAAYGERHMAIANTLQALSNIHMARGDLVRAEAEVREAHESFLAIFGENHNAVAASLGWLATVERARGDYARSAELLEESTAMARRMFGDSHWRVASRLANLAYTYAALRDFASAEDAIREALKIRRQTMGDRNTSVAASMRQLAQYLRTRDAFDEADSLASASLEIERELLGNSHPAVGTCLTTLGTVQYLKGDFAEAERSLGEAAGIHDVARRAVGTGMERAAAAGSSPYDWLALSQLAQGKHDEAWLSTERRSARALADLLADAERRELSPGEAAAEDSLRGLIAGLEQRVKAYVKSAGVDSTAVTQEDIAAVRVELAAAEAAWSAFRQEMAERHPESEGHVLSLAEVQRSLGSGTALLGWLDVKRATGATESWAYVVRGRGLVMWARLSGFEDDAGSSSEDARMIRDAIAAPWLPVAGVRRDAQALWQERIAPVAEALEGATDLVVIPSGPLLGVPVEALVDGEGRYLGEAYEVSYTPSATVYARLGGATLAKAHPSRALFIGDPPFADAHVAAMELEKGTVLELLASATPTAIDTMILRSAAAGNEDALSSLPRLVGTRAEVMLLEETAPGAKVLLGPDASEAEIVSLVEGGELAEYTTIHIATHALVNDEDPKQSALVLSQVDLPDPIESALAGERIYDGLLTAQEIVAECDLDADLVTLSACETGLGKKVVGEGYVGLSQAFLEAGARSLLVSLWKVEDRATALLMQRFYENRSGRYEGERAGYKEEPIPKAAALSEAKAWLQGYADDRGRPYEHPYYWSAFILIGARD